MSTSSRTRPGVVDFGRRADGTRAQLVTIGRPDGILARISDHGATLVELHVPDHTGHLADVVLGFGDVAGYESPSNAYLGATVGRVANRIADATFELEGRRFELTDNEPPHHLHGGGDRAFSQVLWQLVAHDADAVVLRHVSPAGDEGYPGNVEVTATYQVREQDLVIAYRATTDAPTPLDLTNHAYLNLRGDGDGTVLDHRLQVLADQVLVVDDGLVPTGALAGVASTPLDLRTPTPLRERVVALAETSALGLDHHFVLRSEQDDVRTVARLHDPSTGRHLEVLTDQPGLQVYSGNRLDPPVIGKDARRYRRHGGLCLEAHHLPDAVHHPYFPSVVLEPGDVYEHTTIHRFSTS
ncbi:MAG: aldose epimerase family protein [Nitriliruptoraceae bacterium]